MLPLQKLIVVSAETFEEVPCAGAPSKRPSWATRPGRRRRQRVEQAREASTSSRRPSVLTTRCMSRPRRQKDGGGSPALVNVVYDGNIHDA